ncbi:MAG: ABC transporter ATP-binding protein [Ruminococcaceae bacterium]|nr:ABC transporter ATP-binding protein [Oscillospiraceae bacterium]
MIKVENVSFSYGKHAVLRGLSFSANEGECVVLAGPNGSGKSTMLSILTGVIKPGSGKTEIDGKIGYVPQGSALFEDCTVLENLKFFADIAKSSIPDKLPFSVEQIKNRKVSHLSGGMKKQVSIACAFIGEPSIILLDEPCAALDIDFRDEMIDMVKAWKSEGRTVVYVGHDPREFYETFDRIVFLDDKPVIYNRADISDDLVSETQFETLYKNVISKISRK